MPPTLSLAVLQNELENVKRAAAERLAERAREVIRLEKQDDIQEARYAVLVERITELESTLAKLKFSGRALLGLLTLVSTLGGLVGALLQHIR